MKIAIASTGKEEESNISNQAARSSFFLIFNEEGKLIESLENIYIDEMRNAGGLVAQLLIDKGVSLFISGGMGERIVGILESKGIKHQIFSGSVKDAIKKIKE